MAAGAGPVRRTSRPRLRPAGSRRKCPPCSNVMVGVCTVHHGRVSVCFAAVDGRLAVAASSSRTRLSSRVTFGPVTPNSVTEWAATPTETRVVPSWNQSVSERHEFVRCPTGHPVWQIVLKSRRARLALDVAFRLLDATRVKRRLREMAGPLILVVSEDIYSAVVRHGYDGIDHETFHQLVRVQVAGKRYPGWIHLPGDIR